MHRTNISAKFEFGAHSPRRVYNPKMWRFAESWCTTHNAKCKESHGASKIPHWIQPAYSIYLWLRCWENQHRLSSSCSCTWLKLKLKPSVIFVTERGKPRLSSVEEKQCNAHYLQVSLFVKAKLLLML